MAKTFLDTFKRLELKEIDEIVIRPNTTLRRIFNIEFFEDYCAINSNEVDYLVPYSEIAYIKSN